MREGWRREIIKDVVILKSGKTVSKDIEKDIGDVIYTKVGDMNLAGNEINIISSSRYVNFEDINVSQVIPEGSIIFPKRGGAIATNKKRRIVKPTIVDLNTMALIPSEDIISDYLYFWFKTVDLNELSNGANVPQINNYSFDNTFINFPKSIEEQKQIVAILDDAFAAIEQAQANIEKNIDNAKELFDSKKEDLFDKLSSESKVIPIEAACEKIFAGGDAPKENFSKIKTEEFYIPIIANAVKENGLYGYTNEAKVIKPSITIAARGSGTGHTEYRDYPFVPIVRLIVLTPNDEVINVEYLMHAIKSLTILRSGSAIPQLTVPMIKGYSIPVPSKLKQLETVDLLNQLELNLENYTSILNSKKISLEDLKKSLLEQAFAGKLDYKDMPA